MNEATPPPPPAHLITAPTTPALPTPAEEVREVVAASLLTSLRKIGPQAYFEQLARTDPHLFHKYVALMVPRPEQRNADNRTLIQNILSPLPKSPLDALPPDFDIHR